MRSRAGAAGALDGVCWEYETTGFQGLSLRFAVRLTDARLGRRLERMLGSLRAPVQPTRWYSLLTGPDGRVDLLLDDRLVTRADDAEHAVAWLLWDINRAVVEASNEYLLLHAAGVQAAGCGVLLPAPSGAGKSTLTAALLRDGLAYLSDEIVAVSTSGEMLLPYPKPLVFDGPGVGDARDPQRRHVAPSEIREGAEGRACRARVVIFPRYAPGVPTTLSPLAPSEALVALVTNTVNLHRHGSGGLQVLAGLAARCECYDLVMSDLDAACRLVGGVLGARVP